jgi:uncharacterized LabA/DUF88 family protein
MGRPKAVNIKTFPKYNLLHTEKVKMYCGVTMTALFPIKETNQFYISIEVWSHMCRKFKRKKDGFTLNVDIPIITDEKAIAFLAQHAWHDWVGEEIERKDSDMIETIEYLNRIFPNKKKVFFYELDSILSAYASGTFLSYEKDGSIENPSEHDINSRKYYTNKYNHADVPELVVLRKKWTGEKDKELAEQYLTEYTKAKREYNYLHNNLDSIFIELGKNGVGYPVAFSEDTAKWSIEKYGKKIAYAHAGEIYFVVTPDTVYFQQKRHF